MKTRSIIIKATGVDLNPIAQLIYSFTSFTVFQLLVLTFSFAPPISIPIGILGLLYFLLIFYSIGRVLKFIIQRIGNSLSNI